MKLKRSVLFWDITEHVVVIPYQCLGTTYRSHLQRSINPRRKACVDSGGGSLSDVMAELYEMGCFGPCNAGEESNVRNFALLI